MRWIAIFSLIMLAACSSSSNSSGDGGGGNGGSSGLQTACYGQCTAQSNAKGCSAGGLSLSDCKAICDQLIPALSSSCQLKAQTSWQCGSSASWSCATGGNVPSEDNNACAAENTAYATCNRPSDGGND
jgi:hypothetical protein